MTLAVLTALAGAATALAMSRALNDAREADTRAAIEVGDAIRSKLTATTASLAGGDALAARGAVTADEFSAFATGVVRGSGLMAVAWCEPVAEADRARWEIATGLAMHDTDGQGGFGPAAARPDHVVVRYAMPTTDVTRGVVGFDLLSDPVRAEGVRAAAERDGAVLVGPIRSASSGDPGLFVTRAVRTPQGQVVGYLASGFTFDVSGLATIHDVRGLSVSVDGTPLLAGGTGRGSTSFTFGDRLFVVRADGGDSARWLTPTLLGVGTLLLLVVAVVMVVRLLRGRLRRHRTLRRAEQLRALAEDLSQETTTRAVIESVAARAGAIVGAAAVTVGRRSLSNLAELELFPAPRAQAAGAALSILAPVPLAEAARRGDTIAVPNPAALREHYPAASGSAPHAPEIDAVICTPLNLAGNETVGAIGFGFDHSLSHGQLDELEPTVRLIGQVLGRAYDRAGVRELVRERAELLNRFTRSLTSARSVDEIRRSVAQLLPEVLDIDRAELGDDPAEEPADLPADEPAALVHRYPPPSPEGEPLNLRSRPDRAWTGTDEAMALTVADLVDSALGRARLYDQEHAMLLQFQQTLLTSPPVVPGYTAAVNYRSAVQTVDMGGDWYSVIDTDRCLHLVIGDVAGHGPNAAAIMAEIKTILRFLLTVGTPLADVMRQANQTLVRRHTYASATIVQIDKATGEVHYVNAGHLPFLQLTGDGMIRHGDVHRPWLGLETGGAIAPTRIRFNEGDLLVLFTDGLIEERYEPIDDSLSKLEAAIDPTWTPDELVHHLLRWRDTSRTEATVDDDIALVAVRRQCCGR